jgi:hypothetical protein
LRFEPNQGQTDARVKYLSRGLGYSLFLTSSEAVLALRKSAAQRKSSKTAPEVLRIGLVGANSQARVEGEEKLSGRSNYLIGNDPKKWRTNVPAFGKVWYRDIYPGIDLIYYGASQHQLEYDFVVAPNADPKAIGLRFEGADRLALNENGDLIVRLKGGGQVIHHAPIVYQQLGGSRHIVSGRCVLRSANAIGFEVAAYDRSRPLYIDPTLVYSTYLGGSGNGSFGDFAKGIAVDANGFAYIAGEADSANFPTTASAFQTTNKAFSMSEVNAFITKLKTDGSGLVYSTYLGGSSGDLAGGIAVDANGDAYVVGQATSKDFPVTTGAFQTTQNGIQNAFISKLKPDGSGLVYSTFLGGSGNDMGHAIAIDSSGFAYVTGEISSTNFPTTAGAFQTTNHAASNLDNAFVTKLKADGSGLVYSSYLGGNAANLGDAGFAIAVDASGFAYLTGGTGSTNFPTTTGAFQLTIKGPENAFVTKVSTDGTALSYSTYLGGNSDDFGQGIAVDSAGSAYVAGATGSTTFPTTPGAFQTTRATGSSQNAFVSKLKPDGTGLVYSTYLGGSIKSDFAQGIAIDSMGLAYVTGAAFSNNFPLTSDAIQTTNNAFNNHGSNAFVTKLKADGTGLIFSTYFGGSGISISSSSGEGDKALGIAIDSAPSMYIAGFTFSTDFPTTAHAFQTTDNGATNKAANSFVSKITLAAPPPPTPTPTVSPTPAATPTATSTPSRTPTATPTPVPATVKVSSGVNFGKSTRVGTTSKAHPATVKNASSKKSGDILTVGQANTDNSVFKVTTQCSPAVLTPGKSCKIFVTFTPANTTPVAGHLIINDSGAGAPQMVPLSGTGKAPKKK